MADGFGLSIHTASLSTGAADGSSLRPSLGFSRSRMPLRGLGFSRNSAIAAGRSVSEGPFQNATRVAESHWDFAGRI